MSKEEKQKVGESMEHSKRILKKYNLNKGLYKHLKGCTVEEFL